MLDKVIAILKFLDLKPDIEQYKWRFLIQKIVYLAQALGMQFGYHFTIYVAGPYSPALTHDYYNQSDRINSLQTTYNLNSEEREIIEKIKMCCNTSENPFLLECTSTIVYFMKEHPELTDDDIFARTKSLKPYLSEYACVAGVTKAKELLFKPDYLTEELRSEIEQWDRIDD